MIFEYPISADADVPIGDLVFTIDMGSQFLGTLSLDAGNTYFSVTPLGNGQWEFSNTQLLSAGGNLAAEIEVSLNNQVRNLAVDATGTIQFSAITLSYTDPDTPTAVSLPPLDLTVQTQNDTIAVEKAIKTVDVIPAPGLSSSNIGDVLTHSFVNWELKITGNTYTRGFADGLNLTDALPGVSPGRGSVVSVRAGSTFLYKEGDALPNSGTLILDANGNLTLTPPAPGTTYSVIVKYPRASFMPGGLLAVTNTANINGYYKGESGPAYVLSTSTTPATDIVPSDGSSGGFAPDLSKAYTLSITRTRPMMNGGGSSLYGGDIFPRNKIEGTQVYNIVANKGLPGNPANPNGSADVAVYIDVLTYEKLQLDANQMHLTQLKVGSMAGTPVTNAQVYFKNAVADSWGTTPISPDASGIVSVPADTLYAKVVYPDVSGTGAATITATYQATASLISQVESGAINTEAVLGIYAGLAVFDHADGTTSLFPEFPQSSYPTKMISKVNIWPPASKPTDANTLEYMDTYVYKQAESGVNTVRAVTGTRVCDWLFVANTGTASVAWKPDTERFEFNVGFTLDNGSQQGSPIKGFTLASYLPENIFLDTDKIHEGDFLANYFPGEFTQGGQFHAGPIEITMVTVNGVQRQRVVIPLEMWENGNPNVPGTWQGNGHNTGNSVIKLPVYTQDTDRYKSGVTVNFSGHIVVTGYAGLDGNRFIGSGANWSKDKNNSPTTWDGAKITNRDNSIEEWMTTAYSSVTIPSNVTTTFSGVRKYVLDAQGNPVLSTSVEPGKTWKYRIEVVSNQGHLKDVVVYDVLPATGDAFLGTGAPRGSQFGAYLLDVDLSALPANRQPVVYYSTNPAPAKNLTGGDWTSTAPPSADIRAVAFDFGSAEFIGTTGTPDKAVIDLVMGTNYDPSLVNKTTMNNLYSTYNIRRGTGDYTPALARDSASVRTTIVPRSANYATIGALVFRDGNNDGIFNNSDTGLANRPVSLYLNGTTAAHQVDQTVTDLSGNFLFTVDANPGDYYVGFTSQPSEKFSPFTAADGTYTHIDPATVNGSAAFTQAIPVQASDISSGTVFHQANAALSLWYTLTYDANGGTAPPVDTQSPYLAGGTAQVLGAGSMTLADHTWTGWNTRADGTGTAYAAGNTLAINSDTVLFAQWKKNAPVSSSVPSSSVPSSSSTPTSSSSVPPASSSSPPPASSSSPPPAPSTPAASSSSRTPASSRAASSSSSSSRSVAPVSSTSPASSSSTSGGAAITSGSAGSNGASGSDTSASGGNQIIKPQTGNFLADLFQNKVPLGNFGESGSWSLLNLMMALLGTIIALLLLITFLIKKLAHKDQPQEEEEQDQPQRRPLLRWLSAAAGVLTLILFILLEDLTLPYVFINRWTPLILAVFLIHILLLAAFAWLKKGKEQKQYPTRAQH